MAKILIVDDSEILRLKLRELLESDGHTVIDAEDGAHGLTACKEHSDINLLISDFNMPEMDGLQMVEKIRELDNFQDLPVFLLTTESSMELKKAGKALGVMVWIVKPYDGEKVKAIIRKVINK